jgi:threonine aldolase
MKTKLSPIEFRSDNSAGIAPKIMDAVTAANLGSALAYGADEWSARLGEQVREVFEHPEAIIFPVLTGTAANAIALSALCPPWGSVLCHETAHILRSECGSTSMFGAGAVMRPLPGEHYQVSASGVQAAFAATRWGDNHHSQPSVLSLTNPTDFGTVYTTEQIKDLAELAHQRGLHVHMDGARLANAIVSLGCTPADLTWRAGVDMFSLGATKNGVLTADAIVCFNSAMAQELSFRLKRAGQVASKMRFQAAQLSAYLEDGYWLTLARGANSAMQRLYSGLKARGIQLLVEPAANMAFVKVSDAMADKLQASGLLFYRTAPGLIRLVTSFETTEADIDEALRRIDACL